ncbi:hypothetical protein F5X99DRAFT_237089 [Biscogniauxia marginata]|nr:hypothetical protein F5X99DRAFT_237089 [Biscogniauxia marginata]
MARRRLPRWKLVQLLAMASTALTLSLENFQIITSNQIPSSCIRAYSTEIEDCSRSDFTNGNQCSSDCVQGLRETASRVGAACGALNVDSRSLLGLTLSGKLIDALCPGFEATTVTLTIRPSTTQGFTTPIPVVSTTSSTTSTSEISTLQTTTSIPQETPSPPVTSETTESPTQSTTESTTESTAESTTTAETTAETTAQPAETPSATQSTTPGSVPNQGIDPGSGGGSPFDSVPALGLGTTIRLIEWHTPFLLAVLLIAAI